MYKRQVLEHPLTVADLGDGARTAPGERELLAGAQLLHHPSAGSLYLNFYYDLGNVKPEDMPDVYKRQYWSSSLIMRRVVGSA